MLVTGCSYLLLVLTLTFHSGAAARSKRQSPGTSGRITFRPLDANGTLDFISDDTVTVTIQGERVKLTRYLASFESQHNVALYWSSSDQLSPSSEHGFTATLQVKHSESCSRFAIGGFRATVVDGHGQSTFAVPQSSLSAVYECGSGSAEKTFQLKPVEDMDCVETTDGTAERDSLSQPPYYSDGESYTFNCYARCTCEKARSGCVSNCPPLQLSDTTDCRKVIRGSECCEVPECLPEVQTELKQTCASGLNASVMNTWKESTEYPPWVGRVVSGSDEDVTAYVTIINENWVLGPASILQHANSISTTPSGTPTYNITSVIPLKGYIDATNTPHKNLALARLANPQLSIIFTGHGARGVNMAWPSLCQHQYAHGCPLSVFPYLATTEKSAKCDFGTAFNESLICVKSQMLDGRHTRQVVGSGVVSLRSDSVFDLVGIMTEVVDWKNGSSLYHTVLNICPYLEWIQDVTKTTKSV